MTFPSRGCRTCKQRHLKCDEARPVCSRCKKAKRTCDQAGEDRTSIFVDENEFAIGRRKRPRGPNVKTTLATENTIIPASSIEAEGFPRSSNDATQADKSSTSSNKLSILPSPDIPLTDQALTYYSRYYVEMPQGIPEIVNGQILLTTYSISDSYFSQPNSIVGLAISAVSHATFARARRSRSAMTVGSIDYSKALTKTNSALRNANEATSDEVLLAVMLLSFYENSVTSSTPDVSNPDINGIASRPFAHHDGAMAMLKLRRQQSQRTRTSMELDKLIRRQMIRSLLLRSMPVPLWLRDGSKFGEVGTGLELDRCIVIVAKLQHQATDLCVVSPIIAKDEREKVARLENLLAEAGALDEAFVNWEHGLPPEYKYSTHDVLKSGRAGNENKTLNGTVHIYLTVGHAGMWNRYRALRLSVNNIIIKTLARLEEHSKPGVEVVAEAATLRIQCVAEDLCASMPYMLGMLGKGGTSKHDTDVFIRTSGSLKDAVTASTASFLCWPLSVVIKLSAIPKRHKLYFKARLLDLSEIVDDGLLERLANSVSLEEPPSTSAT